MGRFILFQKTWDHLESTRVKDTHKDLVIVIYYCGYTHGIIVRVRKFYSANFVCSVTFSIISLAPVKYSPRFFFFFFEEYSSIFLEDVCAKILSLGSL